jgi:hypothetical protein
MFDELPSTAITEANDIPLFINRIQGSKVRQQASGEALIGKGLHWEVLNNVSRKGKLDEDQMNLSKTSSVQPPGQSGSQRKNPKE